MKPAQAGYDLRLASFFVRPFSEALSKLLPDSRLHGTNPANLLEGRFWIVSGLPTTRGIDLLGNLHLELRRTVFLGGCWRRWR